MSVIFARILARMGQLAAFAAVASLFLNNGWVSASTGPRNAEVAERLELSTGGLGLALILQAIGLAVGALVLGERVVRWLGDRLAGALSAGAFAAALMLIAAAGDPLGLGLALFVLGVANGPLDVAMVALALKVERRRGKTLMPAFEVWFSVGLLLGASVAAWAAGRVGLAQHLIPTALALVALAGIAFLLLPRNERRKGTEEPLATEQEGGTTRGLLRRVGLTPRLAMLAALAFAGLWCEIAAQDWSSLYYRDELGAASTQYGVGNVAFLGAFILAQLIGGRLADTVGARALVRVGTIIFAVAMLVYVTTTSVVVATIALAVAGLGTANVHPLALSGIDGPNLERAIVRVNVIGYMGVAASKLVGVVSEVTSLRVGLGLSVGFAAATFIAARVLAGPPPEVARRALMEAGGRAAAGLLALVRAGVQVLRKGSRRGPGPS